MSLTPYTTGRILFDRDGTVKKLRVEAQRLLRKALPRKPRSERLLDAYRLWDGLDNLEDAVERNAPDAAFVYHHALARLFEIYAKHHRQVVPGVPKLYALLTSERARRKYNHPPFPDKKFASMFAQAVAESDPKGMAQCLGKLTKHVHDKWGGFEIDGFRVRMPIERGAKR
jgi:hypothetical protein